MSRPYRRNSPLVWHQNTHIGKPAAFEAWNMGDSLPVVGDVRDVKLALQRWYPGICHDFTAEPISPTLTRVTRIA